MDLSVTLTQAVTVRNAMSAQASVLYATSSDPAIVETAAILDTKVGQLLLRWATEADKPTVTAFLAQLPGAIKVESITG